MNRYKPVGWRNESWRHSLAAKRIKTKLHGTVVARTKTGIPITVRGGPGKDRKYPISPLKTKKTLDELPAHSTSGITEINFREPGLPMTKQDKAWAQYVRSEKRINVFSQPSDGKKFSEVEPENKLPERAEKHMEEYVLPHEVGHHLAAKQDPNLPIIVEEAKADAFACKENPNDQAVLEKHLNHRVSLFGTKGTI